MSCNWLCSSQMRTYASIYNRKGQNIHKTLRIVCLRSRWSDPCCRLVPVWITSASGQSDTPFYRLSQLITLQRPSHILPVALKWTLKWQNHCPHYSGQVFITPLSAFIVIEQQNVLKKIQCDWGHFEYREDVVNVAWRCKGRRQMSLQSSPFVVRPK